MIQAQARRGADDGMRQCPSCARDDFATERALKIHHSRAHGESLAGEETTCDWCASTYRVRPNRIDETRFCSDSCHKEWQSENWTGPGHHNFNSVRVECSTCGAQILRQAREAERSYRFFCGADCYEEYRRGSDTPNGFGSTRLRHAIERGLVDRKDSVSKEAYLSEADACQKCGTADGLTVHHLVPLKFGGCNVPENLVVLCNSCHRKAEWFTRAWMTPIFTTDFLSGE